MASLPPTTLTPFSNLVKGTYDFDDDELEQLAEMAGKVRAFIDAANKRKQDSMAQHFNPMEPSGRR